MGRLQHAERGALLEIIEMKLSRKSMNLAQRIHWLVAGTVMAPGTYLEPLERLVKGRDDRVRKLAAFFPLNDDLPFLVENLDARTLQSLISLMGRAFEPIEYGGLVTPRCKPRSRLTG